MTPRFKHAACPTAPRGNPSSLCGTTGVLKSGLRDVGGQFADGAAQPVNQQHLAVAGAFRGLAAGRQFNGRQCAGQQAPRAGSYAPFIRKQPLAGHAPKPVIIQFAKGDMTVPNPTTCAILRAGGLAYQANPAVGKNLHVFLTNIGSAATVGYALTAQRQIAAFFASRGLSTIDPDGAGLFFETPIQGLLPESLNFIP